MVRFERTDGKVVYLRPHMIFEVSEVDICPRECDECKHKKERQWCVYTIPGLCHYVTKDQALKVIHSIMLEEGDEWKQGEYEEVER